MIVVKSEVKKTKEGKGKQAMLVTQVMNGTHQNHKFTSWITIQNKNGEKNVIGRGQVASIGKAVGLPKIDDLGELHNKPFLGVVAIKEFNGSKSNELKRGKPRHAGGKGPKGGLPPSKSKQDDSDEGNMVEQAFSGDDDSGDDGIF